MPIPDWSHPNPIFLDFETMSACDIKEAGGRRYVEHPSTRILILAMCIDDVFHVWIPDYIRVNTDNWTGESLWPHQIKPAMKVVLYRGNIPPVKDYGDRPLVAHNSYGFDRGVWERFIDKGRQWLDTLPLARQSGRNGKLDALGKNLLGIGKDHAKKLLPKLTTAKGSSLFGDGWAYPVINAGDLQAFTRYAVGDVEILRRLWSEFDSIKVEADVIEVHDIINNRGIAADAELLDIIEKVSLFSVGESINEIALLTKGKLHEDNIRSGKQVAEWLDTFGVQITDDKGKPCLRKEIVQRFIDSPYVIEENLVGVTEIPPVCIDVMRLRMKALRITDAKVKRAKQRIGPDGRIKDLFSYHQAHTGRWSSNGVQIHNLPRPKSDIAGQVEHILKNVDYSERDIRKTYEWFKKLIPEGSTSNVDDFCSMLIRPSFKAKEGHTFAISDYAQVEARGAAWLAGETKMLEAFAAGRDLYREFAAKVFHVTLNEVTKDMRQIAKSAVLGCIAEGTLIQTNNGPKAIQNVLAIDLIWDGIEYVKHGGVVFKGERECLQSRSIPTMTEDHLVLTSKGWLEASDVITENTPLYPAFRMRDGRYWLRSKKEQGLEQGLPISASVIAERLRKWSEAILRLADLRSAENVESKQSRLQTRNSMEVLSLISVIVNDCSIVSPQSSPDASTNDRSNIGTTELEELRFIRNGIMTVQSFLGISSPYRDGITRDLKLIESRMKEITNRETYDSRPARSSAGIHDEVKRINVRTYDILNSGPRNQFQAGNAIVHNCQYSLGEDKFRIYAANNGCDLSAANITAKEVIDAYRNEYTKIAGWKPKASDNFRVGGLWKDMDKACKECVATGVPQTAGKCQFLIESKDLKIVLPSGRELYYPNARIEDIIPPYCYTMNLPLNPKATVVYDSERGQKSLYGGLLTENITQAMCRDIMATHLMELEYAGMCPVAHVHDEILCEVPLTGAKESLRKMVRIMSTVPEWCVGFPLATEGFLCERFNKSPFAGGYKYETKNLT